MDRSTFVFDPDELINLIDDQFADIAVYERIKQLDLNVSRTQEALKVARQLSVEAIDNFLQEHNEKGSLEMVRSLIDVYRGHLGNSPVFEHMKDAAAALMAKKKKNAGESLCLAAYWLGYDEALKCVIDDLRALNEE